MKYLVNVIFVRNSVADLLPFFRSLLEHTDCRYRLVANGCTAAERAILAAEAGSANSRVDYHDGSVEQVLPHGEMLEHLLELESSDYFVFVDSDILAIGPASFDSLLPDDTEGGRCSALPLWHRPSERVAPSGFRILGGRFVQVEDSDVVVGCSYAAGYRTDRLRAIMADRKIRLVSTRAEQLPSDVRHELARRSLGFDVYDTCKVANILLHDAGWPVSIVELENIVHVGALSAPRDVRRRSLRSGAKVLLGNFVPRLRIFQWRSQGLSWTEARSMCDLAIRRRSACDFVGRLAAGEATIDTAPDWCRDPSIFDALAALYRSDSAE